jgi:hypothetical protein
VYSRTFSSAASGAAGRRSSRSINAAAVLMRLLWWGCVRVLEVSMAQLYNGSAGKLQCKDH